MSSTPPDEPWGSQGPVSPDPPPPPPGGNYPPPPPPGGGGNYPPPPPPPPPGGGYPPPPPPGGGYPPPPPPGGGFPGGGYPGGGHPGGGYPPPGSYPPPGGYPPPGAYPPPGGYGYQYQSSGKGATPFGPASGWWQRVGATIVDGLVLLIPNFIVDAIGGRGVGTFLSFVINAVYITLMLSRRGQTVGNMAVGTRVVDSTTGAPPTPGKAFVRWLSEIVLVILLVIPVIFDILWPLWDSRNQTLHDKMAGTYVIRT